MQCLFAKSQATATATATTRKSAAARPVGTPATPVRSTIIAAAAAVATRAPPAAAPAIVAAVPQPATPSTISLGELLELAGRGQLSLAAPEGLMRDSRVLSSRLVVPVLQGKPTPPIVVQAAPGSGGKVTVVGGSARLAALLAFVSGDSSVAGGAEWPAAPVELDSREGAFIRWNGKSFQQLPDAVKQQLAGYAVSVQQA